MKFTVYRFYTEILDVSSKIYSKYIYTSENSAHFFLKSLPMIVELSSITSYSILDEKLEVGTQILHVNPLINENQRIFIFP